MSQLFHMSFHLLWLLRWSHSNPLKKYNLNTYGLIFIIGIGTFPLTPHAFISIAYLKTSFVYLIGILNLTCPEPSSLSSLPNLLHWNSPCLGRWHSCFQGAQTRKLSVILLDSVLSPIPHTQYCRKFSWLSYKIHPDFDQFSLPPILLLCPKTLLLCAWLIAIASILIPF